MLAYGKRPSEVVVAVVSIVTMFVKAVEKINPNL